MRAATQLELLTRWKRVACHYRLETVGEGTGRCRIGTSDLTDRMIKTGYAWRSVGAPERADGRGPDAAQATSGRIAGNGSSRFSLVP